LRKKVRERKRKDPGLFDFIKQSSLAIEICSQVPNILEAKRVDPRERARAERNLGTTLPSRFSTEEDCLPGAPLRDLRRLIYL